MPVSVSERDQPGEEHRLHDQRAAVSRRPDLAHCADLPQSARAAGHGDDDDRAQRERREAAERLGAAPGPRAACARPRVACGTTNELRQPADPDRRTRRRGARRRSIVSAPAAGVAGVTREAGHDHRPQPPATRRRRARRRPSRLSADTRTRSRINAEERRRRLIPWPNSRPKRVAWIGATDRAAAVERRPERDAGDLRRLPDERRPAARQHEDGGEREELGARSARESTTSARGCPRATRRRRAHTTAAERRRRRSRTRRPMK